MQMALEQHYFYLPMMYSLQVITVVIIFLCYKNVIVSSEATYYAVNTFPSEK